MVCRLSGLSWFAGMGLVGGVAMALATSGVKADEGSRGPEVAVSSEAQDELPSKVDLRPEFKKYGLGPRRQGSRNTCSVFTTAAAMEFALSKQSQQSTPLSVEYLNWACNQVINNKTHDRGQFFHHLVDGFKRYGICLEEKMPYQRRFDPALAPSDEAIENAKEIQSLGFKFHWIKHLGTRPGARDYQMKELKSVLASGYPVAAGASHSRLLVGYEDDPNQPGGGVFFTKDSGSGRFDRVTYEFVERQINDAYWVELPQQSTE